MADYQAFKNDDYILRESPGSFFTSFLSFEPFKATQIDMINTLPPVTTQLKMNPLSIRPLVSLFTFISVVFYLFIDTGVVLYSHKHHYEYSFR